MPKQVTRAVRPDDLRDLLEDPPRATLAFVRDEAIEAVPIAYRGVDGRHFFGVSPETGPLPAAGKLLIDDGPWYYDLRGVWVRGGITSSEPPAGANPALSWYELAEERSAAWHYGTMRQR